MANFEDWIPVDEVAKAAAMDMHEDITKVLAAYRHWIVRGLRKLVKEGLRGTNKIVKLPVNRNLWQAALPLDCKQVLFVGIVRDGQRIPLRSNSHILPSEIDEIVCGEKCDKCNQSKDICEALSIEVERTDIVINSVTKQKVVTRILENGTYYEVVDTWVYDYVSSTIVPFQTKEFIEKFDLLDCNCIAPTEENICKVKDNCNSCYENYYTKCGCCEPEYGGYRVYLEEAYVQLERGFPESHVLVIYKGDIPKIQGEFRVPAVCKEVLIAYTRWISVFGKPGIPQVYKDSMERKFNDERRNMDKVLTRVNLSDILYSLK